MDFEAQLVDSSRLIADMVAEKVGYNPGHFKKLMDLAFGGKEKISMRASRAAVFCVQKYPHLIEPDLKIELMSAIEEQIPKGSTGVKSIGKKLLKKLYKETRRGNKE